MIKPKPTFNGFAQGLDKSTLNPWCSKLMSNVRRLLVMKNTHAAADLQAYIGSFTSRTCFITTFHFHSAHATLRILFQQYSFFNII